MHLNLPSYDPVGERNQRYTVLKSYQYPKHLRFLNITITLPSVSYNTTVMSVKSLSVYCHIGCYSKVTI